MNVRPARRRSGRAVWPALIPLLTLLLALQAPVRAQEPAPAGGDSAVERGRYIFDAAGCLGCHTDIKGGGQRLAGGRALETPFGTFYPPNITPDPETGIGAWSEEDFAAALREGTSPGGEPYYPAFPYPSYAGMTDADVADLFAYLLAQPPVRQENRRPALDFPYNLRFALDLWQALFFAPATFAPESGRDAVWNRGAYLVRHVAHCGECHSPRGWLGAVDQEQALAGNPRGPDGGKVPNLTPGPGGLADWDDSDIAYALKSGMTPDGDFLSDSMGEVIEHSTSRLTDADRAAIASYLKDLPPRSTP
ncbi:MAG TPA: cytochrome c [Kiloniellaceae bacterium]